MAQITSSLFSGNEIMIVRSRILLIALWLFWSLVSAGWAAEGPDPVCAASTDGAFLRTARPKIIGGENAAIEDFPWSATIAFAAPENDRAAHLCGAVIIGKHWLLTAAHCVHDCEGLEGRIAVYAGGDVYGSTSRTEDQSLRGPLRIRRVVVHKSFRMEAPNFGPVELLSVPRNDIALVQLEEGLEPSATSQFALLPEADGLRTMIENGKLGAVAGFGRYRAFGISVRKMQFMQARIYADEICNLPTEMNGNLVPGEMLCGGDADGRDRACKGDSGAGLVARNGEQPIVFGLVSWKSDCDSGVGLGAYTNVLNYRDWIETLTK
ncbi:MAG: serine protease [Hoeflea sp.]|uniref:serine protease n=1 Tax=Hoeflea sp. TaxID=1940281 RepID=UPI0032EAB6E2